MIRSYFRYAFRNLVKQRGRTLINLFGLSFSIAIVIVIYLYVSREASYNSFHENRDRIYQMFSSVYAGDNELHYSPYQSAEMAEGLLESIPGVEATCRYKSTAAFIGPGTEVFREQVGFTDSTFFEMFTYEVLAGDRENPLREQKSMVLTESVARKMFRDTTDVLADMIGLSVKTPEEPPANLYTVTAILADPPDNSSFDWTVLIPYGNSDVYPRSNDFGGDTHTYVMLDEGNDREQLGRTAQELVEPFYGEALQQYIHMGLIREGEHQFTFHFIPFADTYLQTDFLDYSSYTDRGNRNALYILSSIAALILLIACFNYIMISIGTAMNRIGDFGMMQVAGGQRWQILAQFVVESFLLTFISLFLGIVLAEQLVPLFNMLAGEDLKFRLYERGIHFLFLSGILTFIVLVTSAYVGSYLLRRSKPITLIRREMLSIRRNSVARLSVVVQFIIAIGLMISGGIIMKQLNYLVSRDVGFDRDNTLVIHVDFEEQRIRTLKEQFLQSPHVESVTLSDRNFSSGSSSRTLLTGSGEVIDVRFLRVDPDYVKTLGLELLSGRDFNDQEPDSDSVLNVIANETAVRMLDLEEPVGERVVFGEGEVAVDIIGVIRDFHFDSMHEGIDPLLLSTAQINSIWYMFVKAKPGRIPEVIEVCEKAWQQVVPEFDWKYRFLNDILEGQYKSEDRWSRVIVIAALIAILLSCLGLMGISGILVARRYKEVGIRKSFGATVPRVLLLLNRDMLRWILLAYVIACPVSWLIMNRWLQDFAYRTSMSWWIFVLAGLAAVVISVLTTTTQITRTARRNPVEALRYE